MKRQVFAVATLITLGFGAVAVRAAPPNQPGNVAPASGSTSEAMSATKDKMAHGIGVISAEMTSTTKGFVAAAAMSDMYEIAAAQIAMEKSHDSKVKQFAGTMIKAHSKTTAELTDILTEEKLNVTPPATMDTRRQTLINDLHGVKDADFDERYISQQVDAHEEALILMRGYHNSGDNKTLKAFAGKVENAVKMHLAMATRLTKSLDRQEAKAAKH